MLGQFASIFIMLFGYTFRHFSAVLRKLSSSVFYSEFDKHKGIEEKLYQNVIYISNQK